MSYDTELSKVKSWQKCFAMRLLKPTISLSGILWTSLVQPTTFEYSNKSLFDANTQLLSTPLRYMLC